MPVAPRLAEAGSAWHTARMRNPLILPAALMAALLTAAPLAAADKPPARVPSEIVAAAPQADWTAIAASDLLVMDLAPDAKGKPRRVVIQLLPPPFSQGWVGNIRKLAAAHWWDGLSINRVQDNYVVQWGDADGEDAKKAKALPKGLAMVPESEYVSGSDAQYDAETAAFVRQNPGVVPETRAHSELARQRTSFIAAQLTIRDNYAEGAGFSSGWPIAASSADGFWPVHCYGMVGVGRNLSPDTGSGAELYVVIGHAPRQLDRNIALAGRVIEGIEHLSSLPRGTGPLGFYETAEERTPIRSVRLDSEVAGLPAYEYLSTESESFAAYADARANRHDAFYIRPAGGADVCNVPVPVRRVKG